MMTDQLLETEDISSTLAFCSEGYRRQVNTCGRERRQGRDKNYFSEETDQRSVDLRQRLVANSRFLRGPKKRQIDPLRQCLSGDLRRLATASVSERLLGDRRWFFRSIIQRLVRESKHAVGELFYHSPSLNYQ
jgi:hypothetical protein